MKVSSELAWLIPYVEEGLKLVGKKVAVSRLQVWKHGQRCGKTAQAYISTDDHKSFRIYLRNYTFPRYLKSPEAISKIELLNNLAHEMAHVKDMDHSPAHNALEARLKIRFSKMLLESGYISEEDELK